MTASVFIEHCRIPVDSAGTTLDGDLTVPSGAPGVVLFAHGSGSSRRSPRNRAVAAVVNDAGVGTLLTDLLSPHEAAIDAQTAELRFDIGLLTERVVRCIDWLAEHEPTRGLPVGCFGASTGAAAALAAAAARPERVVAVVSRGGRPDLVASPTLAEVLAPSLLIVGGNDPQVLRLNESAYAALRCEKRLSVVPGASHLFEEPGTLEVVAREAADWFALHLAAGGASPD